MDWKPDPNKAEPIFRQIVHYFEEEILKGELAPGSPLPAERQMAVNLGVHRSTVTLAYDELKATGLIQSRQGSGTRVSEHLWGIDPKRVPNWKSYTTNGAFQPSLPIIRKIRDASQIPGIINLARGELAPDLLPYQSLNRLLQQASLSIPLGYPDPKGDLTLRSTLADLLAVEHSSRVSPEQIIITAGAQQALHLIAICLLQPGDAVGLEEPSYLYSLPLCSSAGLRLFRIPMDEDGLLPEAVASLQRKHRIKMIFVNPTYQNSATTTLDLDRRQKLLDICTRLRIPIVEDAAYADLNLQGTALPPLPLFVMDNGNQTVMYVGSLSKSVAPGLRIGWIVGPEQVIGRLADAKQQIDLGTSAVNQHITHIYLTAGEWKENVEKLRRKLTIRRDRGGDSAAAGCIKIVRSVSYRT
ncbi:aminotransferase-like domain-containing protein [Effusibacillus dendaii]|uniref:GntR family transcriptional regulator n=1 Tax=Effusibacillus dendaii TaxID=2743772 RepID=A0A7I8D8A2_9BACL|nr:PLP-dependent aminotransferase family protein [Effusibacillus dendaii]BCJ86344.1 GntR family transcriptional regulator [Effusibacillus dendaii]